MLPKSILKKTSKASSTQAKAQPDPAADRHLATALHHANLIQQQKDVEKVILGASLELIDLPRAENANPATPTDEDAAEFKTLVEKLRPQDYDDLIEERNASNLCGYALCPRPQKKLGGDAQMKLVFSRQDGIRSIPKKELERWCSPECARRALYIKVQLLEEPAWTNSVGRTSQIDLMQERRAVPGLQLAYRPKNSTSKGSQPAHGQSQEIATENSVQSGQQFDASRLVKSQVVEKRVIKNVAAPSLDTSAYASTSIEGYEPKGKNTASVPEEDTDWVV